jgi:hypothetical protein
MTRLMSLSMTKVCLFWLEIKSLTFTPLDASTVYLWPILVLLVNLQILF